MPFDYSDWMSTQSNLADALQRRKFESEMQPERMEEMRIINALREQARAQGEQSFPVNLDIARENLATGQFNRQQATRKAPLEAFLQNVGGLGVSAGADASIAQNPEWAQQVFGPGSVPMRDARGTFPEVARDSARSYYQSGPETARQLNLMGNALPLQRFLADIGQQHAMELAGEHGRWGVRAAEAGRQAATDEHERNRAQAATGAAVQMFVDPKLPWRQQLGLVQSGAGLVKTPDQARTMMETINSSMPQMDSTYNAAMSINRAMGGSPETEQTLIAEMYKLHAQLKQASDALRAKWFSPAAQATPGQFAFPDTSGGYSP